ncbi:MAG: PKD domain-containing protein [Methanobacteriota archaeon]
MRFIWLFVILQAATLILFIFPTSEGGLMNMTEKTSADLINPTFGFGTIGYGYTGQEGFATGGVPDTGILNGRAGGRGLIPESAEEKSVLISNSSLQVDFSGAPTTGRTPLLVFFIDLTKGSPTSWVWDFGDGITGTGEDVLHEYWKGGIYTVQLTATNQDGDSGTRVKGQYITVRPLPVEANFTAIPLRGEAPLTVEFTDQSTGAMFWSWNFGDGSPGSMIPDPDHTFTEPGIYQVRLSVVNEIGESATASQGINVTIPGALDAEFIGIPTSGPVPLFVQFTDHSMGKPISWMWDFGDGARDTSLNPNHLYLTDGVYSVTLTVSDQHGNSDTVSKANYISAQDVTPPSGFLPIYAGWNFVSVPKKLASGSDTAEIFAHIDADGHSILQYNSVSGQWVTMTRTSPVKPLDAVWLYSKKIDTVPLTFDTHPLHNPPSHELCKGWNAVGFTGLEPHTAMITLTSVRDTWLNCIEFNQEFQNYDLMIIKGQNDDTNLHPYHGFWIYMSGNGVITGIPT